MTNNEIVMQGPIPVEAPVASNAPLMMKNEKQYELKTAGFWVRFWAFTLDSLIVAAVIGICINPVFYIMDWSLSETVWYAPISIISALIYYAYFVLMTKLKGQTLGKMVFGLRVVSLTQEKLRWSDVLFREWIGRFINNVFSVLYILVGILPKNQGLHDYFAETTVVHEKIYTEKEVTFKQQMMARQKPVPMKEEVVAQEKLALEKEEAVVQEKPVSEKEEAVVLDNSPSEKEEVVAQEKPTLEKEEAVVQEKPVSEKEASKIPEEIQEGNPSEKEDTPPMQ